MEGIPDEINRPIELNEVVTAIRQLKNDKAAGIDGLVNELFKYGGDAISTATWRLCEEMFRLERIRAIGRGTHLPSA